MKRSAPLLASLLIVAAAGVLHALWTDRWGVSPRRQAAARALQNVPLTIGQWDGRSLTLSERELQIAEADGYVMRDYVNRATGQVVSLLIVCGRPGPISVHPPEVCYRGAGYELASATVKQVLPAAPPVPQAEFRVIDFRQADSPTPLQLRVFYTWGEQGQWSAPDRPRLTYALSFSADAVLFKMYVVRQKTGDATPVDKDPCLDFVKELLPTLQESLFTSDGRSM